MGFGGEMNWAHRGGPMGHGEEGGRFYHRGRKKKIDKMKNKKRENGKMRGNNCARRKRERNKDH